MAMSFITAKKSKKMFRSAVSLAFGKSSRQAACKTTEKLSLITP